MSPVGLRLPHISPLDEPEGTLSNAIAELAAVRGVSERTVWRWVAAMRATGAVDPPAERRTCQRCSKPLPRKATLRRAYCDDVCRVYAWRERQS